MEEAERLIRCGAEAQQHRTSGDAVDAGALLLQARGPAGALLRAWKTAQTLIEQASGIATAARRIVDAASAVVPGLPVESAPAKPRQAALCRFAQCWPAAPACTGWGCRKASSSSRSTRQ
ncbi:MAG: hypothetical protein U1E35_06675 [Rhodospirillales bacterium]